MTAPEWEYERCGEWTFRVAPCQQSRGWQSEARRGEFVTGDAILECLVCTDVHIEFGRSREEALRKLKAEVLS